VDALVYALRPDGANPVGAEANGAAGSAGAAGVRDMIVSA
jgi:hypothetical protein